MSGASNIVVFPTTRPSRLRVFGWDDDLTDTIIRFHVQRAVTGKPRPSLMRGLSLERSCFDNLPPNPPGPAYDAAVKWPEENKLE